MKPNHDSAHSAIKALCWRLAGLDFTQVFTMFVARHVADGRERGRADSAIRDALLGAAHDFEAERAFRAGGQNPDRADFLAMVRRAVDQALTMLPQGGI